jgi:YD repeat-containing protein
MGDALDFFNLFPASGQHPRHHHRLPGPAHRFHLRRAGLPDEHRRSPVRGHPHDHGVTGNLLTVQDPLGHTTTHTYDSRNRLATRTDPLTRTEAFTYDFAGNR